MSRIRAQPINLPSAKKSIQKHLRMPSLMIALEVLIWLLTKRVHTEENRRFGSNFSHSRRSAAFGSIYRPTLPLPITDEQSLNWC